MGKVERVRTALGIEQGTIVAVVGEEAVKREERDQALDEALANTTHRDAHAQHVAHHASTLEQFARMRSTVAALAARTEGYSGADLHAMLGVGPRAAPYVAPTPTLGTEGTLGSLASVLDHDALNTLVPQAGRYHDLRPGLALAAKPSHATDPAAMALRQRRILRSAAEHVAEDGRLVYAVCSPTAEEGEGVAGDLDGFEITKRWASRPPAGDEDAFQAFVLRRC